METGKDYRTSAQLADSPQRFGIPLNTLASIVLLGVVLRALWAFLVPVIPVSDAAAYDTFARVLAQHGVFGWTQTEPFAFWPPGTTFLHASVYFLFGPDYHGIVILNIAMSAGIIAYTAVLAYRAVDSMMVAYISALVVALWPTMVMYVTVHASELPFLLFTLAALERWTSPSPRTWTNAAAAGAFIGFATLIRPVAMLLPLVLAGAMIVGSGFAWRSIREGIAKAGIGMLAVALMITPWAIRNYQLFDEVVLISTNGGITLWMGNSPGTDGAYVPVPEAYEGLPDNDVAKALSEEAYRYIAEDPLAFLQRTPRKMVNLYGNESIGVLWNEPGLESALGAWVVTPMKRFTQITWFIILGLFLCGIVLALRQQRAIAVLSSPLLWTIAYFSAVHAVMVAQDRYHLSFASQIATYCAISLVHLWNQLTAGKVDQDTNETRRRDD